MNGDTDDRVVHNKVITYLDGYFINDDEIIADD